MKITTCEVPFYFSVYYFYIYIQPHIYFLLLCKGKHPKSENDEAALFVKHYHHVGEKTQTLI